MNHSRLRCPLSRERGAVLLAALCFATVLVIAISSYITVCHRSLTLSARSLHGTRSVELAEAGMEEALWALNKNEWSDWTINGTTASRTITGFSFESKATGSIQLQIDSYDGSAGPRVITSTGRAVNADAAQFSRTLRATVDRAPVFVNAVAATNGFVKFTTAGTSSVVDSYDSSVGTYASQTPGYAAIVSAGSTSTASATVQLTNAQVRGFVATLSTGPSYSNNARVYGPATAGTVRIDPDRLSTSPYQPVFDIKTVSGAGSTLNPPIGGTTTIGTPGATSPTIYYSNGLNLTSTTKIVVNGPVKLVISGSLYIGLNGGTPSIEVSNSGTLEIRVSGDIAIYGNGIENKTLAPERAVIYGTNSLTVPDMNTTMPFHGVIYTPGGDFKVVSNNPIFGAIVARNVTFTHAEPVLHYDVNLRRKVFSGIDTPFAVSDWRETTNGS